MTWWTPWIRTLPTSTSTWICIPSLQTLFCCQEVTALNPGQPAALQQLVGLPLQALQHKSL
jgi:hypothetical protein